MAPKRIKVKPSKTQSKFNLIFGLVFCLIGCFVVIPIFGPFGILWTAMAGFLTYSHYKNAYTEEGMPTKEIIIEDESFEENSIESRLRKLDNLYNQGLITRDEYDQKRQKILNEI